MSGDCLLFVFYNKVFVHLSNKLPRTINLLTINEQTYTQSLIYYRFQCFMYFSMPALCKKYRLGRAEKDTFSNDNIYLFYGFCQLISKTIEGHRFICLMLTLRLHYIMNY